MTTERTAEPRPGYRLLQSGREVYDVSAHILRAFEVVEPGVLLTTREILEYGSRPGMTMANDGPIKARLVGGTLPGIGWKRDDQNRMCGFKMPVEIPASSSTAPGTNMVYYRKSRPDKGEIQTSIQPPRGSIRILAVKTQTGATGGVDVEIEWEPWSV